MNDKLNSEILIYQEKDGISSTEVVLKSETVLLTQEQIAGLFDVQKAAISRNLKNIYSTGELDKSVTVSKMKRPPTVAQNATAQLVLL